MPAPNVTGLPPQSLATARLPRRVHAVLERALALVSHELDRSLGVMLTEYEQQLFKLADDARHPNTEASHMQTLRTLRLNRADLVPRFMLSLESGLATLRAPAATGPDARSAQPVSFQNLALVEESVMDETGLLREIATRHEARSSLSLHLLGQRFGVLAGTPAIDAEHLPLGPQALCRAMQHAAQSLQVSLDARLLLYRVFDRRVMAGLSAVMDALDAMMAADGILPALTHVPVRSRPGQAQPVTGVAHDAGKPADTRTPAPSGAREAERPHTGWMGQARSEADDDGASFNMLQQLLTGRRELLGKLRPGDARQPRLALSTREVDAALRELQDAPASPNATPSSLMEVKQTLLAQVRQRRGPGAELSRHDSDIFELLGLLYGQIESEIRTDAPAAVLLRRLQLPLLRVALQDRGFFERASHPARELLNTVAETAAKWLDADDFDPQMLAPLQAAVTSVVKHPEGDASVFAASNETLQAHLQAQARKSEMLERRHVEAARGKEKLEVAKLRATESLATIVGAQRLPKFVHALLNQAWCDVLTLTLLRQGPGSEDWQRQLDVTRRIVLACSKGESAADPSLAAHIEASLVQVGYHADEAAVIAQRLTSSQGEDDAASRTELAMKLKARTRLGEDAARSRVPNPVARTPEEQLRYEQLRAIPFGTWIEFVVNQQGAAVRRRLSWYSTVTDNALFVNQRGQRVAEQSLDSVARMITQGQARIVTEEKARLVDRAWHAALGVLRSFAGSGESHAIAEGTR